MIKKFNYYYNLNFRGIGMFQFNDYFQIKPKEIEIINNYSYFNDYKNYINELENFN